MTWANDQKSAVGVQFHWILKKDNQSTLEYFGIEQPQKGLGAFERTKKKEKIQSLSTLPYADRKSSEVSSVRLYY